MPEKPDGLVKTSGEKRCGPCVFTSAAIERDRIVGERRGAHRLLLETGGVAGGEIAIAGAVRRRVPAAIECRRRKDARIVPKSGAE